MWKGGWGGNEYDQSIRVGGCQINNKIFGKMCMDYIQILPKFCSIIYKELGPLDFVV